MDYDTGVTKVAVGKAPGGRSRRALLAFLTAPAGPHGRSGFIPAPEHPKYAYVTSQPISVVCSYVAQPAALRRMRTAGRAPLYRPPDLK